MRMRLDYLAVVLLLTAGTALSAQVVEDPNGFSFTVPAGFAPGQRSLPTQVIATGYVYERMPTRDQPGFHFVIQPLDGPVELGKIPAFPHQPTGAIISETWQGTTVYGARHATDMAILRAVYFTAWIDLPLDPKPVRVMVVGNVLAETQGRQLLRELLDGVTGTLAQPTLPEQLDTSVPTEEPKSGGLNASLIVVALLLTAVGGAIGWFVLTRIGAKPQAPPPPPAESAEPPPEPEPETPKATVQPPWAVTRDSPGPKPDTDVPPWEYKP